MLESKEEEDDANIVHVVSGFDECESTFLLIFDQCLLLEFIAHEEKLSGWPNEQWYHKNVFDQRDCGNAPVSTAELDTSIALFMTAKFADKPIDWLPAEDHAVSLCREKTCVYKQIRMHGMQKHDYCVKYHYWKQHDRGRRRRFRYVLPNRNCEGQLDCHGNRDGNEEKEFGELHERQHSEVDVAHFYPSMF